MITTIHIVATIIGAILGVFIGIVLYAETPEEESLICKIGWGDSRYLYWCYSY